MTANEISQEENEAGTLFENPSNPRRRILVVDDDSIICQLSSEALTGDGYEVDIAEDGAVAWGALQLASYDLLITDHNMPNLTGVELVKKIQAARLPLPVIMASGTMPVEEFKRHPGLPIEALLIKPYTLAELLGVVRNVLRMLENFPQHFAPPPELKPPPAFGLRAY
jgi:DNA-binding response OmpR family regulator